MTALRGPPNLLTELAKDLSEVARDCRAIGREDEARRLAGAARRLAVMAVLAEDTVEIEPERR